MKPAVCSDKNCQETPKVHMQPVKPAKESSNMWPVKPVKESSHMRSVRRPEMLQSGTKQHIYEECPVKSTSSDKNCQETQMFICGQCSQQRKGKITQS